MLDATGIVPWMAAQMTDDRRQADVVHDLPSLLQTVVLLAAQGWRDHDDADALRHDPAMRLAVSSWAGLTPLMGEIGLPSQPTLSRCTAMLTRPGNLKILREAALELAGRNLRAENDGSRHTRITLDVDSLPIEVHGHQVLEPLVDLLEASRYAPLIAHWQAALPDSPVTVLPLEDLIADRTAYAERLCQALGLPPIPPPETLAESNASGVPPSFLMARLGRHAAAALRSVGGYAVVNLAKQAGLKRAFFGADGGRRISLEPQDRALLEARLVASSHAPGP